MSKNDLIDMGFSIDKVNAAISSVNGNIEAG
jgi:hypothetical protein